MPSGLISTSSGSVSARRISATSLGNGSAERPWNERVQSIFSAGVLSSSSGLSERPVLEMLGVVALVGVFCVAISAARAAAGVRVGVGEVGFGAVDVEDCCGWKERWVKCLQLLKQVMRRGVLR